MAKNGKRMSGSKIIGVDSSPFVVKRQKSHAWKIAWLKSPVRHRTLAPFGGITRIRFKGSSNWTSQPWRLPRSVENKAGPREVNAAQWCPRRHDRGIREAKPGAKLVTKIYPPAGACFTFV
jgi:hypothetical protein